MKTTYQNTYNIKHKKHNINKQPRTHTTFEKQYKKTQLQQNDDKHK